MFSNTDFDLVYNIYISALYTLVTATVFLIVMMIIMRINIYIEQYKCIVRCVHVYYDQDILVSFLVPLSSFEEGY